jgi:hypothetical protein
VDFNLRRKRAEHICWIALSIGGRHEDSFGGVEAVEDLFWCWKGHFGLTELTLGEALLCHTMLWKLGRFYAWCLNLQIGSEIITTCS